MRENVLTELHLPKIDVKCLQRVVKQNTARLVDLLREHDDYVKKSKISPPGYNGFTVSVVSELAEVNGHLDLTKEKSNGINRSASRLTDENRSMQAISNQNNSSNNNNNNVVCVVNRTDTIPGSDKVNCVLDKLSRESINVIFSSETLASHLGWGSSDEDERQEHGNGPRPTRFHLKQDTRLIKEMESNMDEFHGIESNVCRDLSKLGENITNSESEEDPEIILVSETQKSSNCDPLAVGSNIKLTHDNFEENSLGNTEKTKETSNVHIETKESDNAPAKENEETKAPLCVISEVKGYADAAFSGQENQPENAEKTEEAQLITPKKTNDITKIKGWRRKQFFVEKPSTIEFYSYTKGSSGRKKIELKDLEEFRKIKEINNEEPGNIENAFVCDSLDEFLDREADLKISYEIPHLYAEVGIKLTSEDLASKPNLSQEDFKQVETRYCVRLPSNNDIKVDIKTIEEEKVKKEEQKEIDVEVINEEETKEDKEENKKGVKRSSEEYPESVKMAKTEENRRRSIRIVQKQIDQQKLLIVRKTDEVKNEHEEPSKISESNAMESNELCTKLANISDLKLNNESIKNLGNFSLSSKLMGLVVYPGPFRPLHPLVRQHLSKIRSYHTKIDKNWANFAVTAVRGKTRNRYYKRKIVPVFCCGKVEKNPSESDVVPKVVQNIIDSVCANDSPENSKVRVEEEERDNKKRTSDKNLKPVPAKRTSQRISLLKNSLKQNVGLKECRVVINKIDFLDKSDPWCMEHNCYNCAPCRLAKTKDTKKNQTHIKPVFRKHKNRDPELSKETSETIATALQTPFDQKNITSLLTKKLREVRLGEDTSIDNLKKLKMNSVELIKLNFVKQSFLTGYINIWYLKSEASQKKSRAFLTFSKSSPVPNAVNLKSSSFSSNNLPKIITEIVSEDNTFDSNEYAILHCNGELWEIHGSLNFAVGKNESSEDKIKNRTLEGKNTTEGADEEDDVDDDDDVSVEDDDGGEEEVEQMFTPTPLPELEKLQPMSIKVLNVKSVKWWILDFSQKFSEVHFKIPESKTLVKTHKDFHDSIKSKLFGFKALNRENGGRIFGVYIMPEILPFILIGPYLPLETNGLTMKMNSRAIPFAYTGEESPDRRCPLKFFINSAISELKGSRKKLTGLWLYDRICQDNTCYLEVITRKLENSFSKKDYTIEIEHGYSLNSRGSCSQLDSTTLKDQRNDGRALLEKVTVYLYFELFDLGYVKGELQHDNSVIINHPLTPGTRVKSQKVGDWFIGILKRRIRFIPKNLQLRWFITTHLEDLRGRKPFNKLCLGGAHLVCKSGLFYMLKMTPDKIKELGLDKNEVLNAIAESKVINEVSELKNLVGVLSGDPKYSNLTMEKVLLMALEEIEKQEKLEHSLLKTKNTAETEKSKLSMLYLNLIDSCEISDTEKIKKLKNVKNIIFPKSESDKSNFFDLLKTFQFGRKYIQQGKQSPDPEVSVIGSKVDEKVDPKEEKLNNDKTVEGNLEVSILRETNTKRSDTVIKKLEDKLSKVYEMLETSNGKSTKAVEREKLIKKLNIIADELDSIKSIFGNDSEPVPVEEEKQNFRKKKSARKKLTVRKSSSNKITSSMFNSLQREKKIKKKPIQKDSAKKTKKETGFVKLNSSCLPKNITLQSENLIKQYHGGQDSKIQDSILLQRESPVVGEKIRTSISVRKVSDLMNEKPVSVGSSGSSLLESRTVDSGPKILGVLTGPFNGRIEGPLFSPKNKMLIIKNMKNNKTAYQRINVMESMISKKSRTY